MSSAFLNPIPANLDTFIKRNGTNTILNSSTPAAPSGNTNVTWQFDQYGNISAYVPTPGATITLTDTVTGLNYQLEITNGALTFVQV